MAKSCFMTEKIILSGSDSPFFFFFAKKLSKPIITHSC